MYLATVISLCVLILVGAAVLVVWEDRRAAKRHARTRHARLVALGEIDPRVERAL
ncbi:hypothetical protein [Saccharomonospora sp. CUA-673]|uniref:hypothetical protein n=1 Tax=Saccharomonospora sp. CUA-673 TaxID=1904969 RepID=UPI0016510E2F|nr:hypothetical protein [Saccharomonospora sp. CUA-673]